MRNQIYCDILTFLIVVLLCGNLSGAETETKIKAATIYYLNPWTCGMSMSSNSVIAKAEEGDPSYSKVRIEGSPAFVRLNNILKCHLTQIPADHLLHDSIGASIVIRFWIDNKTYLQLTFQHSNIAQWNNIESNPPSEKESNEILSLLPKILFDEVYNPDFSDKKKTIRANQK